MFKKILPVLFVFLLMGIVNASITSVTISSPTADPYYTTNTTPTMTATVIASAALKNATIYGNFSGSWAVNASNATAIVNNTAFSIATDALIDGYYNWSLYVCDVTPVCSYSWAGGHTVIVDTTAPTVGALTTLNKTGTTDMSLQINSTMTETNVLDDCWATIYASNGSTSVVTGTFSSTKCVLDITKSDISANGRFIVEVKSNDTLNNVATGVNNTNLTKVSLYSGWNLIQADVNTTLYGIGQLSGAITSVSLWSNTNHNYTTYVVGISTNNATAVTDGDAVYVRTNASIGFIRMWSTNVASPKNITLTSGWNQVAFFNTTTETTGNICGKTIDNSSVVMQYVSFVDMSVSTDRYKTQDCTLSFNNDISVPKGYGIWVKVNGTTTFGINRN